ncbi:MAG: phosphoenolpyruvate--protein phosphotransferase [Spirochaetaceae bacterium]|jgi:phosphotransferase system enzyme I (PtsI)|nr:phosphoenolpyruvate--protein phosphotransferase [Spirochaetaceae bacterium]
MKELRGIPSSNGLAIGKALLHLDDALMEIPRYSITQKQINKEWQRFSDIVAGITGKIEKKLKENPASKEQRDILGARLLMFNDIEFHENVKKRLEDQRQNIESAVWDVSQELVRKLSALTNESFRERAADVSDIARELLNTLLSIQQFSFDSVNEPVIIVAHDLLPSQALAMDKNFIKAIVTDAGSGISHTAIIARSLWIPAVMGTSSASKQIKTGDILIVDGGSGIVFIDPDKETLSHYQKMLKENKARLKADKSLDGHSATTTDGRRFTLKVNMESAQELKKAIAQGAEGIGLYRSEFLFLTEGKTETEENQYKAYSEILKAAKGLPVTIRTLDSGGDKIIPYLFQNDDEKNPLLGWRSIRFSLSMPDIFMTQLRAILRASVHGKVQIMFPLISGMEELEQALILLEQAKSECSAKNQKYSNNIPVGIMIEVPSAALVADKLIKKSDFFSIGTNDLIQYTLGVDRSNEKVSYLAQPEHPAILHLIKKTIDAAHKKGKPAAMCGEMAGNTELIPLLVGLGLDELSMNVYALHEVKRIICESSFKECQELAQKALRCSSAKEVASLLKRNKLTS